MKYNCKFPKCDYSTNHRSQINYHHIIPQELNGSHKDYNRIWLCPTHHTKIYVPESKSGIHSIKSFEGGVFRFVVLYCKGGVSRCADADFAWSLFRFVIL